MCYAVIRKIARAIEDMTKASSLVKNSGIPNSVGCPGNTRRGAVESRSKGPSHSIAPANRYGGRRENEHTVRANSHVDCRRAHRPLVSKKRNNRC